jgi:hypothetical protein
MRWRMAEPTLEDLLIQLDTIKQQIALAECDYSTCCCETKKRLELGIVSLDFPLSLEQIEMLINCEHPTCEHCATLTSLKEQFHALKIQIFEKINTDYDLTNETNPFKI